MPSDNTPKERIETEMVDVIVILDVADPQQVPPAVEGLKQAGLQVVRVDDQNGVVEGVVDVAKFGAIRQLLGVKDVRDRFEYIAEPPNLAQDLDRGEEPFKSARSETERRALKP